jgi:hypothetical protein
VQSSFNSRNNKQQGRMTVSATPHVMAASPSVPASPTTLSDDANDDVEEEAPVSSLYCPLYLAGIKKLLPNLCWLLPLNK